jgi:ferrochelatase
MGQSGKDFRRLGVVLLNFGGPRYPAEVESFLFNLFTDENIIPIRSQRFRVFLAKFIVYWRKRATIRKIETIGGKSPLVWISSEVAVMLEKSLRQAIPNIRVYAAMRYTAPFVEEVLLEAKRDRVDRFIVLPLYPQFCRVTTGSSFSAFRKAHQKVLPTVPAFFVKSYHDHPLYVSALAEKVREVLSRTGKLEGRTEVIFAAHSVPLKIVSSGDPYPEQVKETAASVAQALGLNEYLLAFQSAPHKRGWLSPTLEEAIKEASGAGCRRVLFIPVSFTCDNVETLYDIDVAAREKTENAKMTFYRAECLNSSPAFIHALEKIVLRALFGEDN